MAQQDITIGVANQGDGDTLFAAFTKVQSNFDDLYDNPAGDITGVTAGDGLTGGGTSGDVTLTLGVDDSTIEINSDAARIKDLGVTSGKLAANSVITDKITDLNVTTAKLADDSVTFNKLGVEYTASTALTSATSIAVDTALSDVFTFTAGHSATLNFTSVGIGDLKSFIITGGGGSYTLAFGTSNTASATYNKISGDFLDTSAAKNLVQIKFVAVNEAWYSISQIA